MKMYKPTLLCLDDEETNLNALERLFKEKYDVLKALNAEKAFAILDDRPDIAVILSDQRMPIITGVEFFEKSLLTHPDTSRILLTGYAEIDSIINAVNKARIFRYMTKPWNAIDLINTVEQACEKYILKTKLKKNNIELETALNELKMLDTAKNQFMILINHELKTPLTAILSFANLLTETPLSEEQKLFTDRILRSSDKLKNIIDDVLLIVRGEIGLIPVNKKTFNSRWFLDNIPTEITRLLKYKNQKINFESKLVSVELDPQLTLTALSRSLHNATKFGLPDSEIEIKIAPDLNFKTIIRIENKGPLISDQIIKKIMQPFCLDENIMNHSVGMGLGLNICNTLMKCQNADLNISNTSDGVCVEFKFR